MSDDPEDIEGSPTLLDWVMVAGLLGLVALILVSLVARSWVC